MGVLSGEMQQGRSCILISLSRHRGLREVAGSGVQWQVLAELLGAGPGLGLGIRVEGWGQSDRCCCRASGHRA